MAVRVVRGSAIQRDRGAGCDRLVGTGWAIGGHFADARDALASEIDVLGIGIHAAILAEQTAVAAVQQVCGRTALIAVCKTRRAGRFFDVP